MSWQHDRSAGTLDRPAPAWPGTADPSPPLARPQVAGKSLRASGETLLVRGVTYGPFRPGPGGEEFTRPDLVERDLSAIASSGFNAVRLYGAPPRWLLDAAERHGLRVLVGLAWEQHVAFLAERGRRRAIEARVREGVRACAGHPAVLCYAVGNEIPASIVRWHGARPVERFLARLAAAVREEDPGSLVSYVNYPTTEYLQVPFADLVCFNVYLEQLDRYEAYLHRLQTIAGDRPLLLAELGLDSRRNGEQRQAELLGEQIRATLAAGCAGAFVFSWTDEWHRGGHDVDDWSFGLTTRAREPKPALEAAAEAFDEGARARPDLPPISVVVCSHNGARTLDDCLDGLASLDYPDYEVIVVDDGSTDETPRIADRPGVHLITTANQGLSSARNTGLQAARGEIVAYLDDDARPDPAWLRHLAETFEGSDHAAVGGPNIPPPGALSTAQCVALAPGGPVHVLLTDREAEHVPGCNLAVRRQRLEQLGGFDPRFVTAGDDVDLCWRLHERGWTIGFSPGAVVLHHRRASLRAYWRQQWGYGRAEALLERKWPERYNAGGHVTWRGRIYADGRRSSRGRRDRVFHGVWGSAPFQGLYEGAAPAGPFPLLPEWYLVVAALAALSAVGVLWRPLAWSLVLLALAVAAPLARALLESGRAGLPQRSRITRLRLRGLLALLHLVQPAARLGGRLRAGLAPWGQRGLGGRALPRPRRLALWSEVWQSPEERLCALESRLRCEGAAVARGGELDRWDLEVRGGLLGAVRLLLAVEEHGGGRQMVRLRLRGRVSRAGCLLALALAALAAISLLDGEPVAALLLVLAALLPAALGWAGVAAATAACLQAAGEERR